MHMHVGLKLDVTSPVPGQGTATCHPGTAHTNSACPEIGAARTAQRLRLLGAFERVHELPTPIPLSSAVDKSNCNGPPHSDPQSETRFPDQ